MIELERDTYAVSNYLLCGDDDDPATTNCVVSPSDRTMLVDWCYSMVDHFDCSREMVAIAMNITDRFVCKAKDANVLNDHTEYQLVAITSLYMANKVHEQVVFGSDGFASLSRGSYSAEGIEDMERKILATLSWRLSPPTALQVAHQVLCLLQRIVKTEQTRTWDILQDEVSYQAENSIRDHYFMTQRPSTTALAAILNAVDLIEGNDCGALLKGLLSILKAFSFCSPSVLAQAMERLSRLVQEGDRSA